MIAKCHCGNIFEVIVNNLKTNQTRSCKCYMSSTVKKLAYLKFSNGKVITVTLKSRSNARDTRDRFYGKCFNIGVDSNDIQTVVKMLVVYTYYNNKTKQYIKRRRL